MIGKEIRMGKLFKKSDRTFILPMDHGITIGPVEGIRNMSQVINSVDNIIDAVIVHKGLVNQLSGILKPGGFEFIIHLSASTSISPYPNQKELVTSVEHAVKLGASAVSIHVNLGSETESGMLKDFGMISEHCETWGMPLLAMMYVRDGIKENEHDASKIKHAARVAEEMGADLVKVNYTGTEESFKEVVNAVKIPVLMAGGEKTSSEDDVLNMIASSIAAGAKGVAIGRNLFQNSNPSVFAGKIRRILDK